MSMSTKASGAGAPTPHRRHALHRWWWVPAAAVLAAVFAAYLQPDLMLDLANRIWSCF